LSSGYYCPTANNLDWCGYSDSRCLGGWINGNTIAFHWNANGESGTANPYPFIYVIRFNILGTSFQFVDSPVLSYGNNGAAQYSATSVDNYGNVAMAYFHSGPTQNITWSIALFDPILGQWDFKTDLAVSTYGPDQSDKRWGDYLRVRKVYPGGTSFAATGWTLDNFCASETNCGNALTPRLVFFDTVSQLSTSSNIISRGISVHQTIISSLFLLFMICLVSF